MVKKKEKAAAYVVFKGRRPGIYDDWESCKDQVDGFSGCKFKGYSTFQEAQSAWDVASGPVDHAMLGLQPMNGRSGQEGLRGGNARAFKRSSPGDDLKRFGDTKRKKTGEAENDELVPDPPLSQNPMLNTSKVEKKRSPIEAEECLDRGTRIVLTPAQQAVVDMALEGDNIFLTGAAGSGKSATLKEILCGLQNKYPDNKDAKYPTVQLTAPTGIAALPLKGKTTWSFAGWNVDSFHKPMEELLKNLKPSTIEAVKTLRVLIIEEISMVENQFLERLDILLKHIMQRYAPGIPFGGKQVIIVGDFHQLPPVLPFATCLTCGESMSKGVEGPICRSLSCPFRGTKQFKTGDKWAFKAPVWEKLNLKHVKLEQIHRQKDGFFQSMLNKIRNGLDLTDHEWKELERKKDTPRGIFPIRLMAKVAQVQSFNTMQLMAINSPLKDWKAKDLCQKTHWSDEDREFHRPAIEKKIQEHLVSLKDHRFQADLTLKVGAKVVLLFNLDMKSGLVNGSQGEVVGFVNTKDWPQPEMEGENGKWRQERVDEFQAENPWRPIVRFENGMQKAIPPVASQSLRGTSWDRYIVCRTQIPLSLGWALSIHKSQGMTLGYVEVSSMDIFETGQLYVGLSRATTLAGLRVTGLNRKLLEMDPDVLAFYSGVAKWVDLGKSNRHAKEYNRSVVPDGGRVDIQPIASLPPAVWSQPAPPRSQPPARSQRPLVKPMVEIIDLTDD